LSIFSKKIGSSLKRICFKIFYNFLWDFFFKLPIVKSSIKSIVGQFLDSGVFLFERLFESLDGIVFFWQLGTH
jgi:hypothetical protein